MVNEEKKRIFKNISPKLTFIFGLILGVAIIGGIGLISLLFLSSQKTELAGEVAQVGGGDENAGFQATQKKDKPEVRFFVMSFCPYGNQAEEGLEPVYQLLKDKVDWKPQYITSPKKVECEAGCQGKLYNEARCQGYVDAGQVADLETCKKYFPYQTQAEVNNCLKQNCTSIKADEYASLHGPAELNQDVRELCVYKNQGVNDYWRFVSQINEKCTVGNIEECWSGVAEELGFNQDEIASCQRNKAEEYLKLEYQDSNQYQANSSPTIFINGQKYQGARTPEDYKNAICSGFEKAPKECEEKLSNTGSETQGGC